MFFQKKNWKIFLFFIFLRFKRCTQKPSIMSMKAHKKLLISIFFVGLLTGNDYAFSQTSVSLNINSIEYKENDYTIPSFTELRRRHRAVEQNPSSTRALATRKNAIDNLKAKEMPYNIVMNIYDDPTSKMAFNWFTNAGITGGQVQIVQGNVSNTNAFATTSVTTVNATSTQINDLNYNVPENRLNDVAGIADFTKKSYTENKALVTGLKPNTIYSFRVGKNGFWSEIGSFTTAKQNKDAFSFVYVTDTQGCRYSHFDAVQRAVSAAFNQNPKANFWIHCGDLIDSSFGLCSEWEWEQLFETQKTFFYQYPFAPVIGNHDNNAFPIFTNHFHTNSPDFDRNEPSRAVTPGSTYSFVYGDALFFAINSEESNNKVYTDALIKWIRSEVAKNPDVKWRIAYYHSSVYTGNLSYQNSSNLRRWRNLIAPVFDELQIDIALQGHSHIYEVIGPVNNKQLVANPVSNQQTVPVHPLENLTGKLGGTFNTQAGTLYFLNNNIGTKKYEPKPLNQMVDPNTGISNYKNLFTGRFGQAGSPAFSNITVTTDTIFITTHEILDDGSTRLFDKFKVVK